MKRCPRCKEELPLATFNKDASKKDGLQSRCRACQIIANREWAERHPETRRAAIRRYYAKVSRSRQASPHQRQAHRAVERALKTGRLIRPSLCEECESHVERIHAHHDDYDKPLEVRWLCARCHGRVHAGVLA